MSENIGFKCGNCKSSITEEDIIRRNCNGTFSARCRGCRLGHAGDLKAWVDLRPGTLAIQAPRSLYHRLTIVLDQDPRTAVLAAPDKEVSSDELL